MKFYGNSIKFHLFAMEENEIEKKNHEKSKYVEEKNNFFLVFNRLQMTSLVRFLGNFLSC